MAKKFPAESRYQKNVDGFYDLKRGVMVLKQGQTYVPNNQKHEISPTQFRDIRQTDHLFFLKSTPKIPSIPGLTKKLVKSFTELFEILGRELQENPLNLHSDFFVFVGSSQNDQTIPVSARNLPLDMANFDHERNWLSGEDIDTALSSFNSVFSDLPFDHDPCHFSGEIMRYNLPHVGYGSGFSTLLNPPTYYVGLVNEGQVHWVSFIYNISKNILLLYDPMGPVRQETFEKIFYFCCLYCLRKNIPLEAINYIDLSFIEECPRQVDPDRHSCGVFCLIMIHNIMAGYKPSNFNTLDAKQFIKTIIKAETLMGSTFD